jgi:hypothetical protein
LAQAATWGLLLATQTPHKQRAAEALWNGHRCEIDKGRLRQLLLDDFHKRFGKTFAKAVGFYRYHSADGDPLP